MSEASSGSLVGRQIGGYQVLALLGTGGVGEVYRARDTRLERDVALKVLQRQRADDPAQRARFLREAQAASALNHPNILAVYDVGVEDGISFIVSELIDGRSLREIVERAPLSMKPLLDLATQIADGLTAAHEAGIVHRDLKPENVMITRDGRVKILDFGLAKSSAPKTTSDRSTPQATETETETGLIQGTVPYMSPEQARGASADFRADQFALGLVMYEMATGTQAFQRETPVQTLSAIITDETPSIAALNPRAPAPLRWVIERCLAKDPQQRYAATRDLAQDLRTLRDRLTEDLPIRPTYRRESRWRSATVILLVVATLAALTIAIVWSRLRPTESNLLIFDVLPPEAETFAESNAFMAVSPDGRSIAFVASPNSTLWVRSLDSLPARPLPGTENASQPFWSPNSKFLAFGSGKKMKRVDVFSGSVETLGDAIGPGSWNSDDVIVASSVAPGRLGPILQVSVDGGGQLKPVTTLDPSREEIGHVWPTFLPDGHHFLYLALSRRAEFDSVLCVGSLDSMARTILFPFSIDSHAVYAPPGYLIYMRANKLVAQRFDADTLSVTGAAPVFLAEPVEHTSGSQRGAFSVSQTGGVLAYRSLGETQLAWFDRLGNQSKPIGPRAHYANPALSPDERTVAVNRIDLDTGTSDIWRIDLASGAPSQVTFDPSEDSMPLWSTDGAGLVYRSNRRSPASQARGPAFYSRAASGAGTDELLLPGVGSSAAPLGWITDRFLLYGAANGGSFDLLALPLAGDRKPAVVLGTPADEVQGQLSPDRRFIAFVSSGIAGQKNVYVSRFPAVGDPWQVSVDGGIEPKWRSDNSELFYLAPDRALMVVKVKTDPKVEIGPPQRLFQTRMSALLNGGFTRNQYEVANNGQRFLINQPPVLSAITVVNNWTALLKR